VPQAIRAIKAAAPSMAIWADVCLCEYTDHGHCGVIHDGKVLNDPTLELLARTGVSHAAAGADVVAPARHRLYRARASEHFVLQANDQRILVQPG